MIHSRMIQRAKIGAAIAVVLVALFLLAGCGAKQADSSAQPSASASAKAGLATATSAVSTAAPDAKLLVVQTSGAVTSTSTPVWSYLFGSPKTDKTYLVLVKDGKAVQTTEYGTANLTAAQWAEVPSLDSWKIDSPEAYAKARATNNANPSATYLPPTAAGSASKALTWYVSFDPQTSNATTGTVELDVKTGAIVAK